MKHRTCIALAAALLAATVPANANEESLSMRAASSLGQFIARQGNAALMEIRNEVKKDLAARLKPYLPRREEIAPSSPSAEQPLTP